MHHYYYPKREQTDRDPSKRWTTTTSSALDETASKLKYDKAATLKEMRDRKMANNKTSISFGNEQVF